MLYRVDFLLLLTSLVLMPEDWCLERLLLYSGQVMAIDETISIL